MTGNALTSSTSSTSSRTRSAGPDRTSSRTPSPPLGGGLRDEVEAAARFGTPNLVPVDEVDLGPQLTPLAPCAGCPECCVSPEPLCAGCGVVILPKAERVALEDTDEAMAHAGTGWHPGCWSAHLVAREHLARARAALVPPTDRRSA